MEEIIKKSPLSIGVRIDTAISGFLKAILAFLGYLLLLLFGVGSLAVGLAYIFEYGEGIYDLSMLEWVFLAFVVLLAKRHVNYCRRFGYSWWDLVSRPLYSLARTIGFPLAIFGALGLLAALVTGQAFNPTVSNLGFVKAFILLVYLIALYLSTPHKHKATLTENTSSKDDVAAIVSGTTEEHPVEVNDAKDSSIFTTASR